MTADLFLALAADPPLRDNRDVMELPFLALSKRRTKPIEYQDARRGISIVVDAPSRLGLATIWDWDLVIAAASYINDGLEAGRAVSPRVVIPPYDLLKMIGRGTSGRDYRELAAAVRRLRASFVETNIRESDRAGFERGFSFLADYRIPKRYGAGAFTSPEDLEGGEPDPAAPWELELDPWLYKSILDRSGILAVHPDYFELSGGIERFLYRLARKSVPEAPGFFDWNMARLHAVSGVTSPLRNFAVKVRQVAAADRLPEYSISIARAGRHERVTLYRNKAKRPRPRRGVRDFDLDL